MDGRNDEPTGSRPTGGLAMPRQFNGVAVETMGDGRVDLRANVSLRIDEAGLWTAWSEDHPPHLVPWTELHEARCGEPGVLPNGWGAIGVMALVSGRRVRWLVPASELSTGEAVTVNEEIRRRTTGPDVPAPDPWAPPSAAAAAATTPQPGGWPQPDPWAPPSAASAAATTPQPGGWPQPDPWTPPVAPAPPTGQLGPPTGQLGPPTGQLGPPGHPGGRGRHGRHRRHSGLIRVLVVLIALLVVAAIVVPLVGDDSGANGRAGGPVERHAGQTQLARQIDLGLSDLPQGWSVDRSVQGPLSSFLQGTHDQASTPAERQLEKQVASDFEQCMGVPASGDRVFGSASTPPTAGASSPAFASASGTPAEEAGSTVAVFSSDGDVSADVDQIADPKFPDCFGTALAATFVGAARQAGAGGTALGQPQVQPVAPAAVGGIRMAGADVTIPVSEGAVTVPIQFGVILVGGGRVEATLYTYSAGQPFPGLLTASLAGVLAHHIAAEGSGTGA